MKKNTSGYSILISLFIIGFLLVLTAGVYQLVLSELQDNRGRGNYLKAQYGAEGAMELALLKIKNIGYGVSDEIPLDINTRSIALWKTNGTTSDFRPAQDSLISYNIDTKTSNYSGNILSSDHSIIPLFYLDKDGNEFKTTDIELFSWTGWTNIAWSIVGDQFWLSWEGTFNKDTLWSYKSISSWNLRFENKSVSDFLTLSNNNYLILFNAHPSDTIFYELQSNGTWGFTKPIGEIYASGKVGSYKQNIKITLDNTTYLNLLKYSIFSNN